MSQVQFKYGKQTDLIKQENNEFKVPLEPGSIYVTTDTHSMFIDLPDPDKKDSNEKPITKRFRIGDFEKYETLKALVDDAKNWYVGSLALIEHPIPNTRPEGTDSTEPEGTDSNKDWTDPNITPILAYYNGSTWININDTTTLEATLQGNINKVAEDLSTLNGTVSGATAAITAIQSEIGKKNSSITAKTIWEAIENLMGDGEEGSLSLTSLKAAIEKNAEDIGKNTQAIGVNAKAIADEATAARAAEAALGARIKHYEDNVNDYATKSEVETAKTEATSDANEYTDSQVSAAGGVAKEYTDEQIKIEKERAMGVENSLQTDINNINNASTGILAQAKGYTDEQVDIEEQRALGIENALRADINSINHATTGILAQARAYTDALANGAVANNTQAINGINNESTGILAQAKAYTDKEVTAEASRATGIETALGNRLNTLEGTGDGSVRAIARSVLAEQLIPENAADALDTLQEIAAWIQSHPGDAAAMNLYISNLEEIAASFIYEKDNSGNFVTENGNLKRLATVTQDAIKAYIDTRVTAVDNKLNWGTF